MPENNIHNVKQKPFTPPTSPPAELTTYLGTPAILAQLALYIAVTAAMGIPLLLVASVLIGGIAALEARRADSLISATTLHLLWSTGMAFLLPVVIGEA